MNQDRSRSGSLEMARTADLIRILAKHELIVGAPFDQDIRVGRMTCRTWGKVDPPWGHVNSLDERPLLELFSDLKVISKSFVGIGMERTNSASTRLMNLAGLRSSDPNIHNHATEGLHI